MRTPIRTAAVLIAAVGVLSPAAASARPYEPDAPRLAGGTDAGSATPLSPGVVVDTLARGPASPGEDGSARYFAIRVTAGETPYVAATIVAPTDYDASTSLGVDVALIEQNETTPCDNATNSDFAGDGRLDAVTTVLAPGPVGGTDGCAAGVLIVRVERSGDAAIAEPLDVEIAYRLEPAASDAGGPGVATPGQNLRTDLTGTRAALTSGTDFSGAPVLADGIYRDTLEADDIRIVRVHLDWGQRFAFSFTAGAVSGVGTDGELKADMTIRNPVRQVVEPADDADDLATGLGTQDQTMSGSTLVPVQYANRRSDDDDIARYSLAGDYYLVLTSDRAKGGLDTKVPYTLRVQVFGTPQPPPQYRDPAAGDSTVPTPGSAAADDGISGLGIASIVCGAVLLAGVGIGLAVRRVRARPQARTHT